MQPPNAPWRRHTRNPEAGSAVTIYYSSDLSPLPIRAVERVDRGNPDNKQDPNLETQTFGLFSTCKRSLRSGVRSNHRPNLFFVTNTDEGRVITGYYEIGWFAEIPQQDRDFALAAESSYFVEDPIPIGEANERCGTEMDERSRNLKYPSPQAARHLKGLLHEQPDATKEYIKEIRRVENALRSRTGFTNVNLRKEDHFTWSDAVRIFTDSDIGSNEDLTTESPTDSWHCRACGESHGSRRRLRFCPNCNAPGAALHAIPKS